MDSWFERFEEAIEMEGIQLNLDENKTVQFKKSSFIACIGPAAYDVLKSYCEPDIPKDKTYVQLKKLLNDNCAPTPSPMAEGYHFNEMRQQLGESLPMWMARIRAKAGKCEFGGMYDRLVKDRFLVGLRNDDLRSHLFKVVELKERKDFVTQ